MLVTEHLIEYLHHVAIKCQGAANEPNLYGSAVSLNGLSDLEPLLETTPGYIAATFSARFIGNLGGDRDMLRENSQVNLVNSIFGTSRGRPEPFRLRKQTQFCSDVVNFF